MSGYKHLRKTVRLTSIFLSIAIPYLQAGPAYADISAEQRAIIHSNINYFNLSTGGACNTSNDTSNSNPATANGAAGGFTIDQVKTFASEPVTSTWNISDSTAEQWFLKQIGAQPVITRYGLNSSNIGDVTSAVKAANVSPVFFYLYTVNEGGTQSGANYGFINHTDRSGLDAVAAAKADADYIVSQSKVTKGSVATAGGEPADMPTAEAQQIVNALPSGSLGLIYSQATAAVTAELETLSGKTGDWSTAFNQPLSDAMNGIKTMGGDPAQGGATISSSTAGCPAVGGVTGQGVTKAVSWAVMIANNNGYGYDQPTRESGWVKWQSDPSCTNACGSFDCSSFVAAALTEAGYFKTNPNFATPSEASFLAKAGFKDVTSSVSLETGANMQPGDILLNTADHTAIYIGNNKLVQASINENNQISGGQIGDQSSSEISVTSYYNYPWNSVWRVSN